MSLSKNTAFSISVRQTDGAVKDISRLEKYLVQLRACATHLRKHVKYLVADGFYSKQMFIDGVLAARLHFIGRLRDDANMKYLFNGNSQHGKGRKKKYAGKFTGIDRRRFRLVRTLENPNEGLYTCLLWHHTLKRTIRVAAIYDLETKKYTLLFSTDTELPAEKILEYYRARFQIEFLFRDAKQHTGFSYCQSRNRRSLHFHFNAALTALNIVKADLNQCGKLQKDLAISIANYKITQANQALVNRIIRMLDLKPDLIINFPQYPELINWGKLAA